ncbi:Class I SAM-dependent methyltransferase [Sulfidibacter corallicola]|uniref:Class I SAM-dependent methyltransferase n=1 Tax=Sulfidibacter corallicola TaxID=2818388 RepID=A0A8A4TVJ5_SULCO|nr:class I SAM-dependent methyltransferase [Sulfidibacter corallicola]QTD50555.1 class I SAM-dependent methyltransferase [Sulfidibacter corallicola]
MTQIKEPASRGAYRLIDAGDEQKLEMVGPYKVVRQAAQAFWPRKLDAREWQRDVNGVHVRTQKGGGFWKFEQRPPESWIVDWRGFRFKAKLTDFGHIGLFPEQGATNFEWLRRHAADPSLHVINLFGYTGGSSLAAAAAGAQVTHVDASKGVVTWARENFELNGLGDHPVRWIVEDVVKYLEREVRRGNRYQGFILDPPTYGRGPKGQIWRIEKDLPILLDLIEKLADPFAFILLSCHTPGFTACSLKNILHMAFDLPLAQIEAGEMTVGIENSELVLPSGTYARWAV